MSQNEDASALHLYRSDTSIRLPDNGIARMTAPNAKLYLDVKQVGIWLMARRRLFGGLALQSKESNNRYETT